MSYSRTYGPNPSPAQRGPEVDPSVTFTSNFINQKYVQADITIFATINNLLPYS